MILSFFAFFVVRWYNYHIILHDTAYAGAQDRILQFLDI